VVIPAATRVTQGITNTHVILVDTAGSIRAFDPADGDLVWSRDLGANVSGDPLFDSDELTVATDKKEIVVISGREGQTRLAVKTGQVPTAVLPDSSNRFLIGDERGNLTLASRDGKRIWRFRNGAQISFLMSYDSEFIAASFDNFIYKISRSGNVEWKRRLSGRAASRPVISGDTAVVSIVGDDSIYFIDLKDGKISNRVEISDGDIGGLATGVGKGSLVLSGTRGVALYSSGGCPGK
jgi:outer membrane protein assembly factor BamB